MKKFFSITTIIVALVASSAAFAQNAPAKLAALPMPQLSENAAAGWKAGVIGCYEQANKRRERGLDVKPVFKDGSGKVVDLPEMNAAFSCHVAGSDEIAKK